MKGAFKVYKVASFYIGEGILFIQCKFLYNYKRNIVLQLDTFIKQGKFYKVNIHCPLFGEVHYIDKKTIEYLNENKKEVIKMLADDFIEPILAQIETQKELHPYRLSFLLENGI